MKQVFSITKRLLSLSTVCLAITTWAVSETAAQTNGGTTAASFLQVGVGARGAGFGGAYTAVCNDATATYWNPAGLARMESSQISFSHFSWLQDINFEQAAVGWQMNDNLTLGAGFTYVNYGVIEGYDINNVQTENVSANDFVASVSAAMNATERLSVGATVKYINQGIGGVSATAFAFDLGGQANMGMFNVGAAVRNVGQNLKFIDESDKLPSSFVLGFSATTLQGQVTPALDFVVPFEGEVVVRSGLEYSFRGTYFVRGGYGFYPTSDERGYVSGATFGAGMRMRGYEINYSFSPEEQLSSESIHRISLAMSFGR